MKRLRTILSRTVNIVCVMIVVAMIYVYIRQYFDQIDSIWGNDGGRGWVLVALELGGIYLNLDPHDWLRAIVEPSHFTYEIQDAGKWNPQIFAWRWWFDWMIAPSRTFVFIPLWFLILLFAIKPAWSFIAWQRRRRRTDDDHQLCQSCGYDLHGITSNQCPECGEIVGE